MYDIKNLFGFRIQIQDKDGFLNLKNNILSFNFELQKNKIYSNKLLFSFQIINCKCHFVFDYQGSEQKILIRENTNLDGLLILNICPDCQLKMHHDCIYQLTLCDDCYNCIQECKNCSSLEYKLQYYSFVICIDIKFIKEFIECLNGSDVLKNVNKLLEGDYYKDIEPQKIKRSNSNVDSLRNIKRKNSI